MPQQSWYAISNLAERSARVDLYDEIGYWGVDAQSFVADLNALDVDRIDLHVSSPGGSVYDGMAILNVLRQHPARVVATVDGIAASAASWIVQAGDEVVMAPNSELMIHNASGVGYGDADTMRKLADDLDRMNRNIASIYAQRAGTDVDAWLEAMAAETWYSAEEAVTAGLADRVLPVPERRAAPDDVRNAAGSPRDRWAVNGRQAAAAWRYPDRAHAPVPQTPVASAAGHPAPSGGAHEEEARVSELLNGLRTRLGLSADADENAALAALDEALAEQADPSEPTNQSPAVPDGHVTVPSVALDELRAQAAQGAEARRMLHEQNRTAALDGLRDRFTPANRSVWEREYDRDPAATVALLKEQPVVVPLNELGHGQDAVDLEGEFDRMFSTPIPKEV